MKKTAINCRNPSGYPDPTAHDALQRVQCEQDEADQRTFRAIGAIKALLEIGGFDLLARIELRDRRTGRTYR